jgi:hypothetical protein
MKEERIKNPTRMTRMLAPGGWQRGSFLDRSITRI